MLLPALSLVGMLGGVAPQPGVVEEIPGGHRFYDPDDPNTYEDLTQADKDWLFGRRPELVLVTAHSEYDLPPEVLAAVLDWMTDE